MWQKWKEEAQTDYPNLLNIDILTKEFAQSKFVKHIENQEIQKILDVFSNNYGDILTL